MRTQGDSREEEWRDAEAYLLALALGVIGLGMLVLFYAATPLRYWLYSHSEPAHVELADLDSAQRIDAAGHYVVLEPIDLDFSDALLRSRPGEAGTATYLPVRGQHGVKLVVRLIRYRYPSDVPDRPVRAAAVEGVAGARRAGPVHPHHPA